MSIARRSLLVTAAFLFASALATAARADDLSGAWTMTGYQGPATHGSATGMLLFTDGRFSLIYTMDENGQRWGRSHAGSYSVSGQALTYHVEWSMEYVSGKPSVAMKPADRKTTFAIARDTLTVTFENGSVQTFRRVKS